MSANTIYEITDRRGNRWRVKRWEGDNRRICVEYDVADGDRTIVLDLGPHLAVDLAAVLINVAGQIADDIAQERAK